VLDSVSPQEISISLAILVIALDRYVPSSEDHQGPRWALC
jgi:hypothetical protein